MRKIEEKMLWAVRSWRNMKEGNTQVVVKKAENGGKELTVYLHGNAIFEAYQNLDGCYERRFTLAGWNTPTTRSRLRALGIAISQVNWTPMVYGQEISSHKWYNW